MWKTVCRAQDVPANGMKEFPLDGGGRVLMINAGAEFFACQTMCPHEAVPLQDGVHDGAVLTCLEHLWQFDLRTGGPVGDAESPLTMYRVKEENGTLLVWDGPPGEG